jgi:hypothetical protein
VGTERAAPLDLSKEEDAQNGVDEKEKEKETSYVSQRGQSDDEGLKDDPEPFISPEQIKNPAYSKAPDHYS